MEETPAQPSPAKISKSVWGKIGTTLGYTTAVLFVGVIVGYNYVMRPAFLEPIVKEQFAKNTNGKLELKLEQTSLFRGFIIKDIRVLAPEGEGFRDTPIFQASEVTLLYNVFGFFRGKFGVHEIALRNANVFIEQKHNRTSVEALLKPSKKEEKPKEEEKEAKAASDTISWFFDVKIFTRLAIENFNFTFDAKDKSNKVQRYAHLKNFNFNFSLMTRDFHSIDTASPADLVSLLDAFVIELNPQKNIDIAYEGPEATVHSNLEMFWLLYYDGLSKQPEFISRMQIGQDKIPVSLKNRKQQNLAFRMQHAITYDAKTDKLAIQDFAIRFLGDTLLALTGTGEKLLSDKRRVEIQTGNSRVNLGKVFEVVSTLTGKRDPAYSGFFSIKATRILMENGKIDDQGGFKLERVSVRQGRLAFSIPTFEFDHAALVNTAIKPIPVEHASAKARGTLNGAPLSLDAKIAEDKKTAIAFSLRGFNIGPFAAGAAAGAISTTLNIDGPSLQDLALNLRVYSPQIFYFVDRSKSGINRIDFNAKGSVKTSEDFRQIRVNLPVLSFYDKNKDYGNALDLKSRVQVEKSNSIKVTYTLEKFTVGFPELLQTLPVSLQEQIGGLLKTLNLGRTLRADGETALFIAGGETQVKHATHIAVPDIHVDDIDIEAKVRLKPPYTYIDKFSITGLRKALLVSADGHLRDTPETVTDSKTGKKQRVIAKVPQLKYKVELAKAEETEILDNSFLEGRLTLAGAAEGNIVDGKIEIDHLSFRNPQVKVKKVNMLFPFKHDLRLKKTLNLRAGNKERIIKNYNFNRPYNFTIASVDIPDPNNKREWLSLIYSRGTYPAIGASMEYKDNVFVMPVMQLYTLNGVVTISDTLFNLGRLRPSEMEYSMTIQIKDIDLKQLIAKDKVDAVSDGKLRIDMLFTGNRLDKPVENLNGYFSIYRIGPEFAETVMRAVMPKSSNIVSTIATNTAIPKRINIELRDGFVYSDIPIQKGAFGTLLFSPDEINNRRINIPEFFQRISNEASVYSGSAAGKEE